ncbi:hypothetical protein BDW22DRAFT_431412 [Trametopsis cervina]|nr:hypothetical protein BDW22DRAFT_431412 [Trametopsis cervina]
MSPQIGSRGFPYPPPQPATQSVPPLSVSKSSYPSLARARTTHMERLPTGPTSVLLAYQPPHTAHPPVSPNHPSQNVRTDLASVHEQLRLARTLKRTRNATTRRRDGGSMWRGGWLISVSSYRIVTVVRSPSLGGWMTTNTPQSPEVALGDRADADWLCSPFCSLGGFFVCTMFRRTE